MITVSMPSYYTDPGTNLTTLLGVTGIDILMEQFESRGFDTDQALMKLIGEGACQKN